MKNVDKSVNGMLTKRQRLYADARRSGATMTAAAISAGCPKKSARSAGSRLEQHPKVMAAIARSADAEAKPGKAVPLLTTEDSMESLKAILRDPKAEPKLKLEAAKALLPYQHKKPGESGKKEQQREAAETVAATFSPRQPPQLRAVK